MIMLSVFKQINDWFIDWFPIQPIFGLYQKLAEISEMLMFYVACLHVTATHVTKSII